MKAPILAAVFLSVSTITQAVDVHRIVDRLCVVESNNRANAVGDGGKALDILQYHRIQVEHGNRIAGTSYTHRDMLDPAKAKALAVIILKDTEATIRRKTGREATETELVRTWNGGASAWRTRPSEVEANLALYVANYYATNL